MMLLHDFLSSSARRYPDRPALICDGQVHSFAQIERRSDLLARQLQAEGLQRGDRVAVFMENSPELVVSIFAISKAGGAFVVVNWATSARKLAYILTDCGIRVLIAKANLAKAVATASADVSQLQTILWVGDPAERVRPGRTFAEIMADPHVPPDAPRLIDEDLCAIIYTSGSTGDPKGVMLTHRNVVCTAWSISTYLENVPDDIVACVLPLSFSYGLYQVVTGARVGFTVLLERSFAYAYKTLQRMVEHRATALPGVPTIFATLLKMAPLDGLDLSSLRYLTNAGAAIAPAHVRQLMELFPQVKIYSMYGQTECARSCYLDPARLADNMTSVGKAIPNSELFVVDERGRPVGPGEVGELVVRGANVMRGYWGRPDLTAQRLREGPIPGEKVLYSGDLFRQDEDGFLYFMSRKDDIFKCKGEKVSPKEIENVLAELPAISEAAAIGVDDPIDGKAVKAVVVLRQDGSVTASQIRQHCRANLDPYMVPKFVEIRSSLPKTDSGKIKKIALVQEHEQRAANPAPTDADVVETPASRE